ncbi:MAG: hypothetical protein EA402_06400 [Planctomycetota bacterium]|nr:MAG: hypothetical protein EA402_06400 [Planctomycetota bacterium]
MRQLLPGLLVAVAVLVVAIGGEYLANRDPTVALDNYMDQLARSARDLRSPSQRDHFFTQLRSRPSQLDGQGWTAEEQRILARVFTRLTIDFPRQRNGGRLRLPGPEGELTWPQIRGQSPSLQNAEGDIVILPDTILSVLVDIFP